MAFNKSLRQIVGSVAMACLATGVLAQTAYPTKPLKIVVPYSAGGPATSTRALSATACKRPGQPFRDREPAWRRCDHRHRRGGEILSRRIHAPHDVNTHTVNESLFTKKPYGLMRTSRRSRRSTISDLLLVVHPSVPANN